MTATAIQTERLATDSFVPNEKGYGYVDHFGLLGLYDKIQFSSPTVLIGPKGTGKSLSVAEWAGLRKVPLVTFDCSEDVRRTHLYGSFVLRGDQTPFVLGPIATAIEIANEVGACVLNFEEINALTPQMQKTLNPITDWRKRLEIPEAQRVFALNPDAKLWVMGSMNTAVYGGIYELNEDLKSRFRFISVNYPSLVQERKILSTGNWRTSKPAMDALEGLLTLAGETRQDSFGYALSTRDLVQTLEDVTLCGLETALWLLLAKFEGQNRATVEKRMASIFNVKPKIKP